MQHLQLVLHIMQAELAHWLIDLADHTAVDYSHRNDVVTRQYHICR